MYAKNEETRFPPNRRDTGDGDLEEGLGGGNQSVW